MEYGQSALTRSSVYRLPGVDGSLCQMSSSLLKVITLGGVDELEYEIIVVPVVTVTVTSTSNDGVTLKMPLPV